MIQRIERIHDEPSFWDDDNIMEQGKKYNYWAVEVSALYNSMYHSTYRYVYDHLNYLPIKIICYGDRVNAYIEATEEWVFCVKNSQIAKQYDKNFGRQLSAFIIDIGPRFDNLAYYVLIEDDYGEFENNPLELFDHSNTALSVLNPNITLLDVELENTKANKECVEETISADNYDDDKPSFFIEYQDNGLLVGKTDDFFRPKIITFKCPKQIEHLVRKYKTVCIISVVDEDTLYSSKIRVKMMFGFSKGSFKSEG